MNNDDRDYYRTKSDRELLLIVSEQPMTAELGIVLAERLDAANECIEKCDCVF